jgi:hypothetical protein
MVGSKLIGDYMMIRKKSFWNNDRSKDRSFFQSLPFPELHLLNKFSLCFVYLSKDGFVIDGFLIPKSKYENKQLFKITVNLWPFPSAHK